MLCFVKFYSKSIAYFNKKVLLRKNKKSSFHIRSIKGMSMSANVRRRRLTIRSINSKRANIVDNR